MSSPVEQIKERLTIADVIGSYLKLERAGASLKAKCPFHNERTPSFFVSPARGGYYCFGCGAKGDMFTFVEQFEGLDFVGALRVLAARAGVVLRKVDPKVASAEARLYLTLEKATRFFEQELERNHEALAYLSARGLTSETLKHFRLGFAPNEWRSLSEALQKEGCSADELLRVGLIKKAEKGSGYYDVFRGRLMFPISDSAGRVIAFSARILPSLDDKKTGKYINSPETALFKKSEVLYAFDKAKLPIRQADVAILVEGQMDALMSHQAGFSNTVAVSGTALTRTHLERLKRLSESIILAFDADSSGVGADERGVRLALSLGMNVRVAKILGGKDPAELIQKDKEVWRRVLENSKHVVDFSLDALFSLALADRELARRVEKEILPLIKLLPSPVEQAHFIREIAERAGLREESLWQAFRAIKEGPQETSAGTAPPSQAKAARMETVARRVFALLFFLEEAPHGSEAGNGQTARLKGEVERILGKETYRERRRAYEALRDVLLAEAEVFYGDAPSGEREETELLRHLEEEGLTEKLERVMRGLSLSERAKNVEESQKLLREAKALSERLASLKSSRFSQ